MIRSRRQRTHIIIILLSLNLFGYCLGNDKPFFKAPTLSTNVTYRSSFCYVFEDVFENGTVDKRDALRGKNLAVGIFDFQINKYTGGIYNGDISVIFLDELARRAGFEWRSSYGVIESPNESNNYTFLDLLFWATDVYDLMGEYYLRNAERLEQGIEFLEPHVDGELVMVTKKNSNTKIQWSFFFEPFSPQLWILLIFTMIISGIFYFFIDYLDSRRKSEKMEATLSGNVFLAAYAFTSQSLYYPRTVSTRIVAWSLCFMYMVLISIYTANMATLLLVNQSSVVSLSSMDDVVEKGLSVCVWKSAAPDEYMKKYYPSAKIIALYTEDECVESLISGECDVYFTFSNVWETLKRDMTYNGDCELESVGQAIQESGGSFTQKESNELCSTFMSHILSLHMIDMKIDGTFEKIWGEYYKQLGSQNCENLNDEPNSVAELQVSMNQVLSLFMGHFGVMVFGLVLSIISCQLMPQDKKKRMKEEIRQTIKNPGQLVKLASFANRFSKDFNSDKNHKYERSLELIRSTKVVEDPSKYQSSSLVDNFEDNNATHCLSPDKKGKPHQKKISSGGDTGAAVVHGEEKCETTAEDTTEHVSYETSLIDHQQQANKSTRIQFLEAMTNFIQNDLDELSRKKSK